MRKRNSSRLAEPPAPCLPPRLGAESPFTNLKGKGASLPESVRDYYEPRFGYDFSQVRVHTGAQAAESARAVNARAFTLGRDLTFGAGEYVPERVSVQQLLAHELAHVVQQGAAGAPPHGSGLERRVEVEGSQASPWTKVSVSQVKSGVQRQGVDDETGDAGPALAADGRITGEWLDTFLANTPEIGRFVTARQSGGHTAAGNTHVLLEGEFEKRFVRYAAPLDNPDNVKPFQGPTASMWRRAPPIY